MLRWRLLAAVGILGPLLLVGWLDDQYNFGHPGLWLTPLAALVALMASSEVMGLLRAGGYRPLSWTVYGGCLLLIAAAAPVVWNEGGFDGPWDRLGLTLIGIIAAVAVVLLGEMARYRRPGSSTISAALAVFTIVYVALPLAFLVHLRLLYSDQWGLAAVVSVLLVVKLSDTGAYFVGRRWGRHKLAPMLSPNKTIEGAVGAVLAGCVASWVFFRLVGMWPVPNGHLPSWWVVVLYGATLTVAGALGDLSESLLKRDMQQKDSSSWLPGLGGVLDVIDSILLAAPVGFLWWASGAVGP